MDTPQNPPWYSSGLRFACTKCGKCCTGAPGYVWVTVEEIKAMAQHLHMDESEFARRYLRQRDQRYALVEMKARNYDCVFLMDGKCRIYECRPRQCQTFPWWKENLSSPEQWQCTAQMCEGICDDAPIVPYEEIQKSFHEPEGHD